MNFDKPPVGKSIENIRKEIEQKLNTARENAIPEDRLDFLTGELEKYKEAFIDRGHRTKEDTGIEDRIAQEIMKSIAAVETLAEFKIMLDIFVEKTRGDKNWARDMLAHENAHANVGEITDHIMVGYGMLFFKNDDGLFSHPLLISKPQESWGPREFLEKHIISTEAPKYYDNELSDGDIDDLEKARNLLKKIEEKERIEQLRNELGASLGGDKN